MTNEEKKQLWEKVAAFHGHVCPGLTIGYMAALYAIELLELTFSDDEQVVCISENDACCVDAIQVMLGCSIGKGNLLFHMTGKMAFSFYNRMNGKSVRLVKKPGPDGLSKAEELERLHQLSLEEAFDVMPVKMNVPERARIFNSYPCDACGERTAENYIRLSGDKKLCPDCIRTYDRFRV